MNDSLARRIRVEVHATWLAVHDPRTPRSARIVGALVAAYALSPIDLIPDFIPVLGLLDDLVLVPAGLWLFRRLLPPELLAEHRATATQAAGRPKSRGGVAIVVAVWIVLALAAWGLVATIWN